VLISSAMYSIITPHSRRESHGFPKTYILGACGDFSIVTNKFRDLTKKEERSESRECARAYSRHLLG